VRDWLAERFEEHRPRLRAVAYRILGSLSEADDAVQGAWVAASARDRAGGEIEPFGGLLVGQALDVGEQHGEPEFLGK
jgi:RNA polymerase sigma-70 factor, ECF subfamily